MVRTLAVLAATALTGGLVAAPAAAQPAPCVYELSPPRVVDVNGTDMVTATVSTRRCDGG